MPLHLATHPLVAHKMTILRDSKTNSADFRKVLKEITFYLGYEASRSISTSEAIVNTPMGEEFKGEKVNEQVAIVPILRAGLGMADGMMDLMPMAQVHHIGMYRAKDSLLPVQYYNRLPRDEACSTAFICDPCIATSNTIQAVCSIVKKWGAKRIVVIAAIGARAGVNKLLLAHPNVELYIGQIDEVLDEHGYIIPGIGDAGDRQFKTPDDSVATVVSKRKRDTDEE